MKRAKKLYRGTPYLDDKTKLIRRTNEMKFRVWELLTEEWDKNQNPKTLESNLCARTPTLKSMTFEQTCGSNSAINEGGPQ